MIKRRSASLWTLGLAVLLIAGLLTAHAANLTSKQRLEVFNMVWTKVRDKHFDPKMNGVDWTAVRKKYEPRVKRVKNDNEFYALLNQMLGELKQSHLEIIPPQLYEEDDTPSRAVGNGETGIIAQLGKDQLLVVKVTTGSAAEVAGVYPGYVITHIDGKPFDSYLQRLKKRKLDPISERLQAAIWSISMLSGSVGSKVKIEGLNPDNEPETFELERQKIQGKKEQFGNLPPMITEFEARRLPNGIGYVRFQPWLMSQLEPVRGAIREFQDAPGIIIDLRGNVGGIGMMASSLAGLFYEKNTSLGTMRLRQGNLRLAVFPDKKPYLGPLVILVDEMSISTSEIMAGSLQEMKRATIIGRQTPGMVLPSQVESLPGGARLQYVFADFRTPKGVLLEGRGVKPNIPIELNRELLLSEEDPFLARASQHIMEQIGEPKTAE